MVKKQKDLLKVPVEGIYKTAEEYLDLVEEKEELMDRIEKKAEILKAGMLKKPRLSIVIRDRKISVQHIDEKDVVKISAKKKEI